MRLLFVFNDLAIGGAQVLHISIAQEMLRRGHDVAYTVYKQTRNKLLEKALQNIRELKWGTKQDGYEVLHLDGQLELQAKKMLTPHWGKTIEAMHSPWSYKERVKPRPAKIVVSISRFLNEQANKDYPVIYNGVDLDRFRKMDNDKSHDLVFLGRFNTVKNPVLAAEAANATGSSILFLGGSNCTADHRNFLQTQKVANKGAFTGYIPHSDIPAYLNRAKVMIVTSEYEGLGLMALEGMACQLPVVAHSVGGLREIIQHKKNGFLVQGTQAESYRESIQNALSNYEKLGKEARNTVAQKFSDKGTFDQYEQQYEAIVAQ